MSSLVGTNSGHGHVWERPDGVKARCGGPDLCSICQEDLRKMIKENKNTSLVDHTEMETQWAVRVTVGSDYVYSEICVSESHANSVREAFGNKVNTQVVRRDVPQWEVVSK